MRRVAGGDRGSVTAEFALAMPAVILALVVAVGALSAAAAQAGLQDTVADAARLVARGESTDRVTEIVGTLGDGIRLRVTRADGLVCVVGDRELSIGNLITIPLQARSCALDGGW